MNQLLQKFRAGASSIGTFTHLKSMTAIECMAYSGLDYVIIDTEHAPVGIDFVADAVVAADAAGIVPVVRINEISRSAVLQPLDVGAKALIVPAVKTVEQVRQLVQYAKFAPLGNRGCCPTRDGGWNRAPHAANGYEAYMAHSNHDTLLIPQCETRGCLEHIEEIAAMDGVDGIFIGPLDLSIALSVAGQFDAPVMQEALKRVQNACKAVNKPLFIFCGDAVAARRYLADGFDSVALSLDAMVLTQAYRTAVDAIKA